MAWNIHLLTGLNDLRFSMPPSRILEILGPIRNSDTLLGGTLTEFRGMQAPVCNYENDELRCIETHWSMAPLLLDEKDLFAMPPLEALQHLETLNRGALYLYGTVFFMDIGLSASNYVEKDHSIRTLSDEDEDEDERGIGIFRANAFAQFRKDCQPISFL